MLIFFLGVFPNGEGGDLMGKHTDQFLVNGAYTCPHCHATFGVHGISTHVVQCTSNPERRTWVGFNQSHVTDEIREFHRQRAHELDKAQYLKPYCGKPHTEESKAKLSKAMIGNTNGSGRGTRITELECTFKSTWEYLVAQYLNTNGMVWTYEAFTFPITETSAYTPDFIIYNEYGIPYMVIEVKGYFWPAALEKFQMFRLLYPQFITELWNKERLQELGIL